MVKDSIFYKHTALNDYIKDYVYTNSYLNSFYKPKKFQRYVYYRSNTQCFYYSRLETQ